MEGQAGTPACNSFYLFVEGLYGCCFVVLNIEDGVQLGDLEQVVDFLGQLEQLELAALVADAGKGAHQFSDAGAVNVSYVAQVEQDLVAPLAHQVLDCLAQHHAAFAQGNTTAQVHNGDVIHLPAASFHCHFRSSSEFAASRPTCFTNLTSVPG